MLHRRIQELEEMVNQRDIMIRSLLMGQSAATQPPMTSPTTEGSSYLLVSSNEDLEKAFKQRVPSIGLVSGQRYVLLPQPCRVRDAKMVLFGNAEIEGSLVMSNCILDATDVTFTSPNRSLPAIDMTGSKSHARLNTCTLRGGRDGLYLSNGARGTLRGCHVQGNVRGVFEGLGCGVSVASSHFDENWFHAILLGSPRHERALHFFQDPPCDGNTKSSTETTRADVVLQYDPVEDRYSDVFRDRVPVILTEEYSTANLCDPAW
jgi:hypothetical protein